MRRGSCAGMGFDDPADVGGARTGRLEFVYLFDWPDEATMRAAWAGFMADAGVEGDQGGDAG